ncbi:MAG: hypothetical protein WA057_01120 [Candidatus Magasanikiibacteriota bacterium]
MVEGDYDSRARYGDLKIRDDFRGIDTPRQFGNTDSRSIDKVSALTPDLIDARKFKGLSTESDVVQENTSRSGGDDSEDVEASTDKRVFDLIQSIKFEGVDTTKGQQHLRELAGVLSVVDKVSYRRIELTANKEITVGSFGKNNSSKEILEQARKIGMN